MTVTVDSRFRGNDKKGVGMTKKGGGNDGVWLGMTESQFYE